MTALKVKDTLITLHPRLHHRRISRVQRQVIFRFAHCLDPLMLMQLIILS
jgi:hypothetical protein